jgi:lysophospholipid acyltransferase (LPLAT)-like uncharacterized protein
VSKELNNADQPASLSNYSFFDRLTIHLADWSFYLLILLIGRTIRFEVEGWENFEAIEKAGKIPIYAFWHDRIFASTYFFRDRGIAVITSQSKDGEYIARFIQRLGYGAIRGSSTRGGVGALVEMIRTMRQGVPMAFTLDGPKGPRYEAKSGAVLLAKKTENPLMPFVVECSSYWSANSWDLLQIPKPFTRAKLFIGQPISVPTDAGEKEIEDALQKLQGSLDELVIIGKEWSSSLTN